MSTLTTIKELILRQLEINPDISLKDAQKVIPKLTKGNFYKVKRQLKESTSRPSKHKKKTNGRKAASTPPIELPVFDEDEIDFTKEAYIKAIEAGHFNLLTGWVAFLDKTGKLQDYKTNREEALEDTFKYMTARELVLESIGHQREVDTSERKQLRSSLLETDS